ncbi:MAG TPA: Asp-tRNA(Asn)/Glu-tRNA(Gln) amidotransferase subunit GatB [Chitinivibrionales bacterium]|nr:Asp-tRNA(Asn)/Glu-tRNA(Gln) amidotransferase subunit GatB [Chitinivibrionales bacterium]
MEFETVIGLEIHAQLLTKTKIFCGCATPFGDAPNTHGCPVCLGLPGSLPVLNRSVVEMAVRMGLAVNSKISRRSIFARKNYFYPDLPKGYQISQYDMPLCRGGAIEIEIDGKKKSIGITRVHLEEDAGKLVHDQDEDSLFDVNRCGTPLIEIVSEPDLRSGQEAHAYLTAIKQILEYLDICDCNMEEGSLRCDANISIRPKGEAALGTKTELKNMNTFRGVEKALEYEALRQKDAVMHGEKIEQQTYLWDPNKNQTVAMRTKESAHDYRYFPEPDLLPLMVSDEWIDEIRKTLPELPKQKRQRFIEEYGITPYMADVVTTTPAPSGFFENTVHQFKSQSREDNQLIANWIMGEALRVVKEKKMEINRLKVTPEKLATILRLVKDNVISANAAKKVFDLVESTGKDPETIIEEQGLKQISDSGELEKIVNEVVAGNPREAARFKAGETKLAGFFVGQVMKATKGKGNPKEINRLVAKVLG